MAEATLYCDQCGRVIQSSEMSRGEAIVTPQAALCAACAGQLTPEQRSALLKPSGQETVPSPPRPAKKRRTTSASIGAREEKPKPPAVAPGTPLPARGRRPSGTMPRPSGVIPKPAAPVDFPEFEPELEKPKKGKYVMAGVVVLLLAGVLGFFLLPGKGKDPAPGDEEAAASEKDEARPGDRKPDPARKARLDHIRSLAGKLTADSSYSEYKDGLSELDSFLTSYPDDKEGLSLKAQVDEGYGKLADETLRGAHDLARRLAASGFEEQAAAKLRSVAERFGKSAWYSDRGKEAIDKALNEIEGGAPAEAEVATPSGPKTGPARPRPTTASSRNAVTNSGFEILGGRGIPVDWSLPRGVVVLEEDGNHFVRIEELTSANKSTFFSGRFKLDPKWGEIHLSCRMRARHLRTGRRATDRAMCLISFEDGKRRKLKSFPGSSPQLDKSSDWVQLDGKAAVPKGAEYLALRPGLYRSLGTVDFDDITAGPEKALRLEARVTEPEAKPKAAWDRPGSAPAGKPSGEADVRRALGALAARDFAGARKALSGRGAWREADGERAGKLLAKIDEAEAAAVEADRLRREPYAKLLISVNDAAREGIERAKARFQRERKKVPAEKSRKVEYLRKRLREAELVESVIVDGLVALRRPVRLADIKGNRVAGRVQGVEDGVIKLKSSVGKTREVRLVDVRPKELVRATRLERLGAVTRFQLACFAHVLGDMDAASEWAAEAEADGVLALREDIELLRAVLAPGPAVAVEIPAEPAAPAEVVVEEAVVGEAAALAGPAADVAARAPGRELSRRMDAFFSRVPKDGIEGLYLTRAVVLNLAGRYDGAKVSAKKLAAVGGAVAGSSQFDALLKRHLKSDQGYRFARTAGVAGAGKSAMALQKGLGKYLEREKPEFVRVCLGTADLAKGRTAADLKVALTGIVDEILGHGALPVLFTLAVPPPTEDEARKAVTSYNQMVVGLAAELNVPCVDAWVILNRDPALKHVVFGRRGALTKDGYERLGRPAFYLYRILEKLVAARDVPIPLAFAAGGGETAVVEEPPPPAGNIVTNGGFEKTEGAMPTGWKKHDWGEGGKIIVRSDRMESKAGRRSLLIRSAGPGARPGAFTKVTLVKGTYEVRFWATAEVDETVNLHVRHGDTELPAALVTGEWKEHRRQFNVYRTQRDVSFAFCLSSPTGRVWIDEVELRFVGR